MAAICVRGNILRTAAIHAATTRPVDNKMIKESMRFAEIQFATGEFPHTEAIYGDEAPARCSPGSSATRPNAIGSATA